MEYRKESVLGLFMIYINNIVDCVAGNTKIYHTLYSDHEDVGLSALQSDLCMVQGMANAFLCRQSRQMQSKLCMRDIIINKLNMIRKT